MHDPDRLGAVVVDRRGSAAWVTLNRPAVLNAVDDALIDALCRALDHIAADDDIRVVVLTGAGRAFCAGADLRYVHGFGADAVPAELAAFSRRASRAYDRLATFPKPTIAAVNGVAVGGGLELLLCCDLVIAADTAMIGDGHGTYGLMPGGGGTARLPRRVGASRAKELMLTGKLLPAPALVSWGLVSATVAPSELDSAVAEVAAGIAAKSPLGLRAMKQLADAAVEQPLGSALEAELDAFEQHVRSADVREGLAAFAEGRDPVFGGR